MTSADGRSPSFGTFDLVVIAILSAVSAVAYVLMAQVWTAVTAATGPLGGAFIGVFQFGHVLAFAILRKPGVAFATSFLTTVGQLLLGDPSGAFVLGWGVVHGLGAELVFGLSRWRKNGFMTLALAAGVAAVLGQFYSFLVFGWSDALNLFYLSLPILFFSSAIESGGIAFLARKAINRAIDGNEGK
jgi:energy-coupling factor transport system substrate-specific component